MAKKITISKSDMKTCRCAYLHCDGHLVIWHEKKDKQAGKVEWVTVYQNIGINVHMEEGHRLIISKGVLPLLGNVCRIDVHPASIKGGSDNTKKLGLAVETIGIYNSVNGEPWFVSNFPGVISSDIYSYTSNDTFEDIRHRAYWGDLKIAKMHLVEETETV